MDNVHSIAEMEVKRLSKMVERYRTMIQILEEENFQLNQECEKVYRMLAQHPSRP